MVDKNQSPSKLLWLDLEMTGLDPAQDVILEVAVEITDFEFNTLETYETRVKQSRKVVVEQMDKNIWWRDYPENRDEFLDKLDEGKPQTEVEKDLLALVDKHFGDEPAYLAGNSIYNDRGFIKHRMPHLHLKLHYRMLDVSSWKIFMQGRYGVVYDKKEVHRAFDDTQASIAELQYYLGWLKENA